MGCILPVITTYVKFVGYIQPILTATKHSNMRHRDTHCTQTTIRKRCTFEEKKKKASTYLVPWFLIFAKGLLHDSEFIFGPGVVLLWWHEQKWQTYRLKQIEEQLALSGIKGNSVSVVEETVPKAVFKAFNTQMNNFLTNPSSSHDAVFYAPFMLHPHTKVPIIHCRLDT